MLLYLMCSLGILILQTENSRASQEGLTNELSSIHREIGLLKDENQQQNFQISLLKDLIVQSHRAGDDHLLHKIDQSLKESSSKRVKRPYRLLPIGGHKKDDSDSANVNQQPGIRQFYGPPANCSDLSKLGYTLNGFYTVTSSSTNSTSVSNDETNIETVFCAFKQPHRTFNGPPLEKRTFRLKSEGVPKPPSAGIFQLKLVNNKNVINFRSQLDGNLNLLNVADYKIIFTDVVRNVGNGFHETTGAFLAPKSGVYQFIFKGTLLISPNHSFVKSGTIVLDIHLVAHNDSAVGSARYVMDSGYSKELGIEETLKLDRGEKVYLLLEQKMSVNLNYFQLDGGKSSFSGFLLHEFEE